MTSDSAEPRYLLSAQSGSEGNQVHVLFDGAEAYPAMLHAIESAKVEVLLEMYILAADDTGVRFIGALVERARAGVLVAVLIDGFGSFGLSEVRRDELRAAGVRLAVFHPVRPWRPRWAWSVRDHRKMLVVDGALAFAGGLNLSNEYAPATWRGGANWHDVNVQVEGPAVAELRRNFLGSWHHASSAALRLASPVTRAEARSPAVDGSVYAQVLGVGGLRERRRIRKHYQFLVRRAQRTVRIMVGYFIPDRGWLRLLCNAARRGVDVRIMFPRQSDVQVVQWAARATYGRLLRAGVRIFEWTPSMLHAKTISVDRAACAIGSYNLDRRSLLLNWELSLLVVGGDAARALEARFEADERHCVEIELEPWSRRGVVRRLIEHFFYAFRGWL